VTGRRAAVLGSPVGHSLSPALHRRAYEVLGLPAWSYGAHEVTADGLAGFLAGLDGSWAGLSLTMPLKAAVLPLLDEADDLVHAVGAANTLVLGAGGRRGANTDVPGMVAALAGHGRPAAAAVLGGGATARSSVAALGRLGARVTVFSRSPERSADLYATAERLGVELELRPWAQAGQALGWPVVVNTTPAGAADALAATVPGEPGLLFEVLYEPWPTPLAAAWSAAGGAVVGGLELLVQQAVLQVALMTGVPVDVPALAAELRAAGQAALRSR
jgi:shikimate dehydrogenase